MEVRKRAIRIGALGAMLFTSSAMVFNGVAGASPAKPEQPGHVHIDTHLKNGPGGKDDVKLDKQCAVLLRPHRYATGDDGDDGDGGGGDVEPAACLTNTFGQPIGLVNDSVSPGGMFGVPFVGDSDVNDELTVFTVDGQQVTATSLDSGENTYIVT